MFYVYSIFNKVTDSIYIGQSKNPLRRWSQHQESNTDLGQDIVNFGVINFEFRVLAGFPEKDDCLDYENYLIIKYSNSQEFNVYNKEQGRPPVVGRDEFTMSCGSLGRPKKPILCTNIETGEEFVIESAGAGSEHGFTQSAVSNCANGRIRSHRKHTFRFATEEEYMRLKKKDDDSLAN